MTIELTVQKRLFLLEWILSYLRVIHFSKVCPLLSLIHEITIQLNLEKFHTAEDL